MNLVGLHIGASGLNADRIRMNIISTNIANAQTTRTPDGGPYRRQDVVFSAQNRPESFEDLMRLTYNNHLKEVAVDRIVADQREFKKLYQPSHPDADEKGFVNYPNISVPEEMTNLMTCLRSYEANASVIESTKSMAMAALQIGRA
jgi:flagellar basal-body rod protein FlgC